MKHTDKQFVISPTDMGEVGLDPKDQFILLSIRKYMNKDTNISTVSLKTLSKDTTASINTIRKSIDKLAQKNYLEIIRDKKCFSYKILDPDKFEPFSYDFIENSDLSFVEKAYVVAAQQYMFKDIKGLGKISMCNSDLANKINSSERTIRRTDKLLEEKGLLAIVKNDKVLPELGFCKSNTKIFFLAKMLQDIIWTLRDHEDRLLELEQDKYTNNEEFEKLNNKIKQQDKVINKLVDYINKTNPEKKVEYKTIID